MDRAQEIGTARRALLSVDLDEWYHCRWATGAPHSRWKDTATFFREHYHSDRPTGELVAPTRATLDVFDRLGVKGTFFILGEVGHHYPDLVREIADRGHEIGCHGWSHRDIDLLGEDGFRRELADGKRVLSKLGPRPVIGYRAPNLLLRDWQIPILRAEAFEYDVSVCTSRSLLGKDFGHRHVAVNPYRFRDRFSEPDPQGDMVEIPLGIFPGIRLPAATGILTRVLGMNWTLIALRQALRTGDVQYYFHPYELGPRPEIPLSWRQRLFLRRLGPWMEDAVERVGRRLQAWGARFVTGAEMAAATRGSA